MSDRLNTAVLGYILDAAYESMQAIPLNGTSVPLTLVNAARMALNIQRKESLNAAAPLVGTLRECAEIARRKQCTDISILIDDAADGILEEQQGVKLFNSLQQLFTQYR